MKSSVIVLPEARDDLIDIYKYVAEHDSVSRANALLDALEEKCLSLSVYPKRGHTVSELNRIHIESFKEVHHKPYRIIFQISDTAIYIHAVLDGRRDLQDLLERRILRY